MSIDSGLSSASDKQPNLLLQIYKILSNFDSNPLIFDSTLFPGKNSPNIAKSNHVFSGKRRGDRALTLGLCNFMRSFIWCKTQDVN